jgi:SAM-dependent methyltransferase
VSQWTNSGAGRQYDDARPPWPVTVEDFLRSIAPQGRWEIAIDLAAGTGRLTEHVAAVSAAVIAVEPSAAMRAVLADRVPAARAIDGSAEAIPVPDCSADLVVAGNAFHWFDPDLAAAEIERVLRPDGVAAALWHLTEWPEWFGELSSQLADYRNPESDAAGERAASGGWRRGLEARFGSLTTTEIATYEHVWSRHAFTELMGSASYIAALHAPRRDAALAIIRGFLEDKPQPIPVQHRVEATWARRANRG